MEIWRSKKWIKLSEKKPPVRDIKKWNQEFTNKINVSIFRGCITMTYFSINFGIYAVVITLSVSHGVGFSLMYAQAIGAVIKWFIGNRKGKKCSIHLINWNHIRWPDKSATCHSWYRFAPHSWCVADSHIPFASLLSRYAPQVVIWRGYAGRIIIPKGFSNPPALYRQD